MNTNLPPSPFYVLIVAKTHMKKGFCVGGIAQNGCSVRLDVLTKHSVETFNDKYEVGDVWLIKGYKIPKKLEAPHFEDIVVLGKEYAKKSDRLVSSIEQFMPPIVGGVNTLFGGAVRRFADGRLYIGRQQVPQYSTLFWRPDRPLHLGAAPNGKFRYHYDGEAGDCFFSYVGTANAVPVLPAGTLIRVSLARWFEHKGAPEREEACYLQVSGWFDEQGMPDNEDAGDDPATQTVVRLDTTQENGVQSINSDDPSTPITPPSLPFPPRPPVQAGLSTLLKAHFGFDEFRPYQREIIESVLARRDTLAVMSTGAGKSLCYQLPALAFSGLTVVISPLISLMQDQVSKLEQFGIAAAALNSTTVEAERERIKRRIRAGQLKLLYLSPERLVLPTTIDLLLAGTVECLVVDEAHCISQWGHDFRPEYREIMNVRKALGDARVLALTATATAEVRDDIVANLNLQKVKKFVAPFNRPNLFLAVQPRHGGDRQVLDFLALHKGQTGIIYCLTREVVNQLATKLQAAGFDALPYHAGLDAETRSRNQHRFIRDDGVIMVATVAFGMGIDKPDIRFVLHFNLTESPESYYQQIGRAGRDGERADCLLLYAPKDFATIEFMIKQGDPEQTPEALARLQHMKAWIADFSCRRKWLLEYFGEQDAPDNCGMCDACVAANGVQVEGSDDITQYASLFLTAVKQVHQRFGLNHVVWVLHGSRAQRLAEWGHDKLSIFGQGHAITRTAWKELAEQFFALGLVTKDSMGVLKLSPLGQAVLDGEKVYGYFKGKIHPAHAATANLEGSDGALFDKLRVLRRKLADERGVPSFFIFSDRSLRDMSIRLPQTVAEFRQVHGVGEYKCGEFGEAFLEIIRGHGKTPEEPATLLLPVDKPKTGKAAAQERRESAIAGLQAGKSLDEISDECGVKPVTILRYVYDFYKKEGQLPLGVIVPRAQVSSETRDQVFAFYAEKGTDSLGPIYWELNQSVEYIDLDLLRIEYLRIRIEQ